MARHNPLGKIKDLTVEALKTPTKVAGLAVDQARGAATAGLHVADHVTRSAVTTVGTLVQQRRGGAAPDPATERGAQVEVDPEEPVNVVEELGLDAAPVAKPKKKPATKAASAAATSIDAAADAVEVDATPADVAKKIAKKAPARKTAAKKTAGKKTAATKTAAKKTAPTKSAATKAPATKAAKSAKTSPSGKLPPRKQAVSAADLASGAGTEAITPVGTRGAGVASNPSTAETDLQQPGTEPLMDPATTKAVKAEQDTGSRAADTDKS